MEGIGVAQTWFLSRYHGIFEQDELAERGSLNGLHAKRSLPVKPFSDIFAKQFIRKADQLFSNPNSLLNSSAPSPHLMSLQAPVQRILAHLVVQTELEQTAEISVVKHIQWFGCQSIQIGKEKGGGSNFFVRNVK